MFCFSSVKITTYALLEFALSWIYAHDGTEPIYRRPFTANLTMAYPANKLSQTISCSNNLVNTFRDDIDQLSAHIPNSLRTVAQKSSARSIEPSYRTDSGQILQSALPSRQDRSVRGKLLLLIKSPQIYIPSHFQFQ